MPELPQSVSEFLGGKRFAVAGVSRSSAAAANAVFKKLLKSGYEVFPVNPNAEEVEGVRCYADIAAVPDRLDGGVVATHPDVAVEIVRQCVEADVPKVWFHRSFGAGSVSQEALSS